jgi:hypothetical protein
MFAFSSSLKACDSLTFVINCLSTSRCSSNCSILFIGLASPIPAHTFTKSPNLEPSPVLTNPTFHITGLFISETLFRLSNMSLMNCKSPGDNSSVFMVHLPSLFKNSISYDMLNSSSETTPGLFSAVRGSKA